MKAAGGYTDVEVEGIAGRGLEQVEDVEMEGQPGLAPVALRLFRARSDCHRSSHSRLWASRSTAKLPIRWFHEHASVRGSLIERSLDVNRVTIFSMVIVSSALMSRAISWAMKSGLFDHPTWRVDRSPATDDPGSHRLGDACGRLTGMGGQGDGLAIDCMYDDIDEVVLVELAVACHTGVVDVSVDGRADREATRPVLCADDRLEPRGMRVGHADEAALVHSGHLSQVVLDAQ